MPVRGRNPLERRVAAVHRKGHDAEAGADRAQIRGNKEWPVLGEQSDAVAAGKSLRPQATVPAAGGGTKFAVRDRLAAEEHGRAVSPAAG